MPININEIETESLGPLSNFKQALTPVTLFYGHNEKGKTFLVELLLTSLFKNLSGFKNEFRISKPIGKVFVTGIENNPVILSPTSKNKLESIWEDDGRGMPPNIARLLVVKSGDTEIDKNNTGGISRNTIREFLSSQGILESIQKNISLKSTQAAKIEDGTITGPNTGDIRKRKEFKDELDNIVRLLERIDHELADGDVISLETEISLLKEKMDNLEAAKKHAAYKLSKREQQLEGEINRFNDANFETLEDNFKDYQRKRSELSQKNDDKKEATKKSKNFLWLKNAIDEYKNHFDHTSTFSRPTLLIVGLILLIVAILLIAVELSLFSIIAILLAIGIGFLHLKKTSINSISQLEISEIENIRANYEEKFSEPCKDLATMGAKLEAITSSYHAIEQIDKDIEKFNSEIRNLEFDIRTSLNEFIQDSSSTTEWEETISRFRQELNSAKDELSEVANELSRYDVDPSEYVVEDPGIVYNREDFDKAFVENEKLGGELEDLEHSLQNLKSEIQGKIGEHTLNNWEELIHKLREMRLEIVQQYEQLTTNIIAGNILYKVVENNLKQEDNKLLEQLDSDIVKIPLAQIAKNYIGVEIDGEEMVAINEYNQKFEIKDLSTGAREQILLALRIGFAKNIMRGDSAFLILDDAFQHSDWNRRPIMVETMFELAEQDWQIIYFSMDDNIRDLFDKRGKKARKGLYTRIDL